MAQAQTFKDLTPDLIREQIEASPLAKVVGEAMGLPAFIEAAMQLLRSPGLMACTQESVLGGLLKAAIFRFRVSPELGQCWLVPRNMKVGEDDKGKAIYQNVATFQIGYKGWQELAFRSGIVESFDSAVVWEKDTFDYEMGTTPFLKHKPFSNPLNKGIRTYVWASATMASGRIVFHVVPIDEIERHRRMSDTQISWQDNGRGGKQKVVAEKPVGIWEQHYDAMAKRVPMRYLCQLQLPKSDVLLRALEADGGVTNFVGGKLEAINLEQVEKAAAKELHDDYVMELESECRNLTAQTTFDEADEMRLNLKSLYERRKDELEPELLDKYQAEFRKVWEKIPSRPKEQQNG